MPGCFLTATATIGLKDSNRRSEDLATLYLDKIFFVVHFRAQSVHSFRNELLASYPIGFLEFIPVGDRLVLTTAPCRHQLGRQT